MFQLESSYSSFQRILGDPTIQDADQWKDGSDCMMCQKHNHIQIEMNEF